MPDFFGSPPKALEALRAVRTVRLRSCVVLFVCVRVRVHMCARARTFTLIPMAFILSSLLISFDFNFKLYCNVCRKYLFTITLHVSDKQLNKKLVLYMIDQTTNFFFVFFLKSENLTDSSDEDLCLHD